MNLLSLVHPGDPRFHCLCHQTFSFLGHVFMVLVWYGNFIEYVIMQVYPGKQVGGLEADMMASNELKTHAFLQVH